MFGIRFDKHTLRLLAFLGVALPAFSHEAGAVGLTIVPRVLSGKLVAPNAVSLVAVVGASRWSSCPESTGLVTCEAAALLPPSVRVNAQVIAVQRVPTRTVRPLRILGCWTCPPQDVDAGCDGLQMRRIEAGAIPAQVVNRESFWNTALPGHVGGAVARSAIAHPIQKTDARSVAVAGSVARPVPTLGWVASERDKQSAQISASHGRVI
jgi:hypothetical protein